MRYLIKSSFRRKGNYWIAAASELLGAPFRGWRPMPVSPAERAKWHRGLLIGADHIGDILYGTSSLPTLAAATPNCAWFHAVRKPGAQILETNPHLAGLLYMPPEQRPGRWLSTYRLLRDGNFDVVVCYDSFSYVHNLATATAARIPARIGYVHKGFSCLPTHPIRIRYSSAYAHYFRDMVEQITGETPPSEPRPRVYPTDDDERAAAALFEGRGLHHADAVLACSIFTRASAGIFSPHHFIETLQQVQKVNGKGVRLVFLASPGEREEVDRLLAGSGLTYENVAGELSLRQAYCFLRRCSAAFAIDSGVRHLANAAGIPVIFARNLYFDKQEAGTYCSTEIDICSPAIELLPREETRREVLAFDHTLAATQISRVLIR